MYLFRHESPESRRQELPAGSREDAHELFQWLKRSVLTSRECVPYFCNILEVGGKWSVVIGIEPLPR